MMRKWILKFAIVFLLLSISISIISTNWNDNGQLLSFIILCIGTLGSIISIFIPNSSSYSFRKESWKKSNSNDNIYILSINSRKHGMGISPKVECFIKDENGFSKVITNITHNEKGDVLISSATKFSGKLIITK